MHHNELADGPAQPRDEVRVVVPRAGSGRGLRVLHSLGAHVASQRNPGR
jgi:hypothetical protein